MTTRGQSVNRTVLAAAAAALIALAAWCPGAAAQDNSLFRRGPQQAPRARQVPTTQPASGIAVSAIHGTPRSVRATLQAARPTPQSNELLLRMSPFAVAAPQPETIEVNDLVTIIVRISKSAKSDSKLKTKKEWDHEWKLDDWIRFSDLHGIVPAALPEGKPAVKFQYEDEYKGDGKYDRKDSLTTRVQARVIDVKPNGNLVLEARNDVRFGEEDYTVTLTGVCRSDDMTPQNTVLSSQIAELEVRVVDRGALRDATRRGWLKRTLDLLRPF